jgi:flagellar hook-length control protein FliK
VTSGNPSVAPKSGPGTTANSVTSATGNDPQTQSALTADPAVLASQVVVPTGTLPSGRQAGLHGKPNPGDVPSAKSTTAANSSDPTSATTTPPIDSDQTAGDIPLATQAAQAGATNPGFVLPFSGTAPLSATKGKGSAQPSNPAAAGSIPQSATATTGQAATATDSSSNPPSAGSTSAVLSAPGIHANGPRQAAAVHPADANLAASAAASAAVVTPNVGEATLAIDADASTTTKAIGPAAADNSVGSPATQNSQTSAATTTPQAATATGSNTSAAAGQASGQAGASGMSEVDRVRFVQRVARAFQAADQDGGQIRLRLSPPELGSLKLDMTLSKGTLTAHVETETSTARTMLLDSLPQLRERLAEHNIKIDQFDVSVMNRSRDGSADNPTSGYTDAQNSGSHSSARNTATPNATSGLMPIVGSSVSTDSSGALNVLI